ncbi:uncharacterized protein PSFLO_06318 [Pseudozyma flocculosa]|uniref:CBS domain-containing protein n=1 Tax=Pseudozyma flocculosa TaxID=84751 RepID=A0A5C3F9R8_9BASI|nr:uncharacterized protein PSFLO_06318 [Pseudozyma flocculosa]
MSTSVAVPIAINRSSPSRSPRAGSRKAAELFRNNSAAGVVVDPLPVSSSPKQVNQSRHGRRASRIEVLTELLLPGPAYNASRFGEGSIDAEQRQRGVEPGIMPVDGKRAEALRTALRSITAKGFLDECPTATRPLAVLPANADVDMACQELAKEPGRATPLLLQGSTQRPGASADEAGGGISGSRVEGYGSLLNLEDVHSFLCLLFCPSPSKETAGRASWLTSPPSSPGAGRGRPLYPVGPLSKQAAEIAALIKANKKVPAALIANLSGSNKLRAVPPSSTLEEVLTRLIEPGVSHVVVTRTARDDASAGEKGSGALDTADMPLGLISRTDLLDFLSREAKRDEALAAVLAERLDELSSLSFTSPATPISSDKSVLDAMTLMHAEALDSLAILDARGVLLSPLSSAELAFEVIRADSRKILNTPLATLVKTLRSRRPEGTDGKDTHPAVSISLSSQLSRAVSLMQTTSAKGIFVLDDLIPAMTPPLSTISPSSPTKEQSPWHFGIVDVKGSGGKATAVQDDESAGSQGQGYGSASKPVNHRRSSTSFWTAPRSRGPGSSSSGASGTSLSKVFASTAVGGPGFVRCHRPRSMSLAQGIVPPEVAAARRDSGSRVSANALSGPEGALGLSRSSSLSVSTSSSSTSSLRGGSEGATGTILAASPREGAAVGASAPLLSAHNPVPGSGWAVVYAEASSLAPVRFHLSAGAILAFIARCAALQQP